MYRRARGPCAYPCGGIYSTSLYKGTNSARRNVVGRTDPGGHCQETFTWGLRNPFRFAFDPDTPSTGFLISGAGESVWEKVDESKAGVDCAGDLCEAGEHKAVDLDTPLAHPRKHMIQCRRQGGGKVKNGLILE